LKGRAVRKYGVTVGGGAPVELVWQLMSNTPDTNGRPVPLKGD
jgi:hypothetical protein